MSNVTRLRKEIRLRAKRFTFILDVFDNNNKNGIWKRPQNLTATPGLLLNFHEAYFNLLLQFLAKLFLLLMHTCTYHLVR